MNNAEHVPIRDRRVMLLAALADVAPQTAQRFLNGEELMRKPKAALEAALVVAREKHPEIIGGGA